MAAQPMPQPQQEQAGQGGDPMKDFRQFAEMANQLGKQYPEAAEPMAQILKLIQGAMVKVSTNGQRTPPQQPPPQG